jgi:hypothetical protein
MWTQRFWHAVVAVLVCAACRNSNFCPGANPNNNCSEVDAAPQACGSTADCPVPQVCDVTETMTCVQCTLAADDACTAMKLACVDNTCQRCTAHDQCGSLACLPDGSCGDDSNVAYVDPGATDNMSCTKMTPCTKILRALATMRDFVKLTGTSDEGGTVTIDNRNVTLLADPKAKLTRTSNGIVLEVRGTSQVSIYDLEISGGSGAQGIGILVSAGTGSLSLVRARVIGNAGGGLSVNGGTFVIVGNVFFNNGSLNSTIGGVAIATAQDPANRLEFNSFSRNQTQNGLGSAVQCVAGVFSARNNIMSDNGTSTNMEQVGGTCSHAYSIARPGTPPSGMTNTTMDPLFKDTATGDLHLKAGSPALRAADPSSDLAGQAERDIDGDARRGPADIGADEAP